MGLVVEMSSFQYPQTGWYIGETRSTQYCHVKEYLQLEDMMQAPSTSKLFCLNDCRNVNALHTHTIR
jgi:hypothetical protein